MEENILREETTNAEDLTPELRKEKLLEALAEVKEMIENDEVEAMLINLDVGDSIAQIGSCVSIVQRVDFANAVVHSTKRALQEASMGDMLATLKDALS